VTSSATSSGFAGFRFPREVISLAVRWYLRSGLSYRDVAELLADRGITVDHVTMHRWVQRFTPEFIEAARPGCHAPGDRWFADETAQLLGAPPGCGRYSRLGLQSRLGRLVPYHTGVSTGSALPGSDMYGYTQNKDDYLKRLRRIEGQVRGLQRMIDEDQYCIDILTQVAAATKALQSVAIGLLEEHLGHCVAQAVAEGGDTASDKIREASDAIARLVRS
jgi:DNA-binding FrmR family transcriptional regulator